MTFIHGGLATVGVQPEDHMSEAYATIGLEPTVPMESVTSVYRAKIKYAHLEGIQGPEEREVSGDRVKRLNLAYEVIQQARQGR